MLPNHLVFKVLKSTSEVIDLNGYIFRKYECMLYKDVDIDCYINEKYKDVVEEGCYLYADPAKVTSYESTLDANDYMIRKIALRVDHVKKVEKEAFLSENKPKVCVNLLVVKNPTQKLTYKGPERKPFMRVIGLFNNEFNVQIPIMLITKYKRAIELDKLPRKFFADVQGIIVPGYTYKAHPMLVVTNINMREEVCKK